MPQNFSANDPQRALEFFKSKMSFTTGPVELSGALKKQENICIVDVRAKADYDKGHIPGAISLPESDWSKIDQLQRENLNVIYCYSHVCHLAARAAVQFAEAGFPVMELDGGFKAWREHNLEVEGGDRVEVKPPKEGVRQGPLTQEPRLEDFNPDPSTTPH